jgi:hypothetical protein
LNTSRLSTTRGHLDDRVGNASVPVIIPSKRSEDWMV